MQNNNIFSEIMIFFLLSDDVSNKKIIKEINETYSDILDEVLEEKKWIPDLDFDIIKIKGMKNGFKIVPNNAISAFWTSNILIDSKDEIKPYMKITIDGVTYWFDEKQKTLKHK